MTNHTARMAALLGELRREMNGAVAESMQRGEGGYGLNYGVSIPTIRAIAGRVGTDHAFARFLYRQDVRELRMAAPTIADPASVPPDNVDEWFAGRLPEGLIEELALRLLSPCGRPVLDTLEHGTEHVALEISFPGRDRTIELSVTTSRIHNTHGEMIGALVIFSDLTARKETQRRMAQAERLATLGELMAGVAHEVRNPLTAIRGYVQILRQQTRDPIHQEYLSVVLKEIDSINKVIQQLLEFSRPRHSQWQQVSLNALVEETLVLVQTAGVQARVDFISELDNELSPINADRELLKQVLLNILINAVQAISARGKIRIRTWQYSDSQQAISIEDNGSGIDLSLQKKIFDPFFTTKASGTGLGLALSQRIINAHQGDIRVASLPGYGATFTLILPINPQGNQTV